MFGKYKVVHRMHVMITCKNDEESVTKRLPETIVFTGTKEQCEAWMKIQVIDAAVKLVELDEHVEIERDRTWSKQRCVTISVSDYDKNKSWYYWSAYYLEK